MPAEKQIAFQRALVSLWYFPKRLAPVFVFSDHRLESVFFQKGFYDFPHVHFVVIFGGINLPVDGIVQEAIGV